MPNINLHTRRIDWAAEVMNHEASSIKQTVKSLDENFSKAIDILLVERGKIIVTGIGKSGHLGKRVAATLCSTGTSAAFLQYFYISTHSPHRRHGGNRTSTMNWREYDFRTVFIDHTRINNRLF